MAAGCRTTKAPSRPTSRRGRISERSRRPERPTLPLQSQPNASPFWIMLLLRLGATERKMILQSAEHQTTMFESFRARQLAHCWHDCFVPCVGKLLPRRARRGSAVEAGTVLLLPSIRIERLMAVGGIGWGQAVSGLYARRRRDWQPPQTGPATSIACIAVRVTRPPPRFCQPISRCDWSMASHAALRVRDPWPSNKPNTQAKPTVADGPK